MESFLQGMTAYNETRGPRTMILLNTTIRALGPTAQNPRIHLLLPDWETGNLDLTPRSKRHLLEKRTSPQTPHPREPLFQNHRTPNSHATGTNMHRSYPTYTRVPGRKKSQRERGNPGIHDEPYLQGRTTSPRTYMERTHRPTPSPSPLHISRLPETEWAVNDVPA